MDDFEWDVLHEGQLLDAMVGHKPVGINRYFQMAFIWDKLTENSKKDVQSTKIWTHLESLYNLPLLDKAEALPFPNEEREFNLPESDFGILKQKIDERKNLKGRETPKLLKEIKKDETKTPTRNNTKEIPRRDSKDSKDIKTINIKKEIKKDSEKVKLNKGRNSTPLFKEEQKIMKNKIDEILKPVKRPTRGSLSLKSDDGSNGGKSSPTTVLTASITKRRRI